MDVNAVNSERRLLPNCYIQDFQLDLTFRIALVEGLQ